MAEHKHGFLDLVKKGSTTRREGKAPIKKATQEDVAFFDNRLSIMPQFAKIVKQTENTPPHLRVATC
jgi:hypothetical protein